MKATHRRGMSRGFTFIELLITLALVGLVSMMTLPLYEMAAKRSKEAELRQALRTIRAGLDTYKAATDAGTLPREAGTSGYPPSLETLTEPLEMQGKRESSDLPAANRMVILRRLPRDPFNNDPDLTAAETWNTRAYASSADDPQPGDDVFDVSSKSDRRSLDGTPYSSW